MGKFKEHKGGFHMATGFDLDISIEGTGDTDTSEPNITLTKNKLCTITVIGCLPTQPLGGCIISTSCNGPATCGCTVS